MVLPDSRTERSISRRPRAFQRTARGDRSVGPSGPPSTSCRGGGAQGEASQTAAEALRTGGNLGHPCAVLSKNRGITLSFLVHTLRESPGGGFGPESRAP